MYVCMLNTFNGSHEKEIWIKFTLNSKQKNGIIF